MPSSLRRHVPGSRELGCGRRESGDIIAIRQHREERPTQQAEIETAEFLPVHQFVDAQYLLQRSSSAAV
jgi:hypothetical protein